MATKDMNREKESCRISSAQKWVASMDMVPEVHDHGPHHHHRCVVHSFRSSPGERERTHWCGHHPNSVRIFPWGRLLSCLRRKKPKSAWCSIYVVLNRQMNRRQLRRYGDGAKDLPARPVGSMPRSRKVMKSRMNEHSDHVQGEGWEDNPSM